MKLKKYLILIFVMGLMAFGSAVGGDVDVQAEKITDNGFEYAIESNGITITDYVGNQREVIIPSVIDGYPVKKISHSSFAYCDYITSVTIPDSVTIIEDGWTYLPAGECGAFEGCTGLISITIPDSVTTIGKNAFKGCTSLTSITIPDSVTTIGENAFGGCTGLTNMVYANGCTAIDLFNKGCSGLTSITIPDSVTSIGNSAFSGCSNLTGITIPNSVTNIGNDAFWGCSSLNSIIIPDSVTSIEARTFCYCTNLTSVTIPDSVTNIGDDAFAGCTNLNSITIPNSVTRIGFGAFEDCDAVIYFTGTEDEWKKTHDIYIKNTVYFINDTFPDQITLDNTELTLYVYDEYAPHVTLTPSDVTVSKIYWKSSAPDIASCTEDGTIIAWKEGTATITAVTANGISASVNVTILASPEDSCEISGHTEYTNYGYPATCITTGLTDGTYCSVCGKILTAQEEIPALGHSWGVWSAVILPTVTSEGQRMRTCMVCLTSEIQTIPRLGTEPPVPDTPSVENPSTHTPTPSRIPTTTLKLPLIKARPAQVGKVTAKNKKKRTLDLSWKKTANTNGYEIQYSTSKKFKSAKKKLTKKTKTTIKNLKKKTYYIRIRSFMYDGNNKKLYSKWSTVKKIRIKK